MQPKRFRMSTTGLSILNVCSCKPADRANRVTFSRGSVFFSPCGDSLKNELCLRSLAFLVKVSFRWGDLHHQSGPSPPSRDISPVKVPALKRDLPHLPPPPSPLTGITIPQRRPFPSTYSRHPIPHHQPFRGKTYPLNNANRRRWTTKPPQVEHQTVAGGTPNRCRWAFLCTTCHAKWLLVRSSAAGGKVFCPPAAVRLPTCSATASHLLRKMATGAF